LRAKCCGEYQNLTGGKQQEDEENYRMRNFKTFIST
jgi:hypothetical protein